MTTVNNKLEELKSKLLAKMSEKDRLEKDKAKALVVRKKHGLFSRIASAFHRGKYYEETQGIEATEITLKRLEQECKELETQKQELSARKSELEEQKSKSGIPECIEEKDGRLVITDNARVKGFKTEETATTSLDSSKKVLVHCTNFFPIGNRILSTYDGNYIGSTEMEYRGVKKEVRSLSHRHSVHCTVNNRVKNTSDGAGTWDNPTYMIVERFDFHEDEMEDTKPSDAWTNGTSIALSSDAVILVRYEDKDKLPISEDEINMYNIIYYDGDPTTCLQNFLKMNDYYILETEANYAGHAKSVRMDQERACNGRDLVINFVKDNSNFSKEPQIYTAEEIAQIVDIAIINPENRSRFKALWKPQENICIRVNQIPADKEQVYSFVANFVVASGLIKTEDGRYTFKTDEEILEDLRSLDIDIDRLPDCVDTDLIREIFELQQQIEREYEQTEIPSIDDYSSMTLNELYQFNNQLPCEALQRTLPENAEMIYTNGEIKIRFFLIAEDYQGVKKNINDKDEIYCEGTGGVNDQNGYVFINIPGTALVSDIDGIIESMLQKVKTIRDRGEPTIISQPDDMEYE